MRTIPSTPSTSTLLPGAALAVALTLPGQAGNARPINPVPPVMTIRMSTPRDSPSSSSTPYGQIWNIETSRA